MEKKGNGAWWALGIVAAIALVVTVLYFSERRVRRLCRVLEGRLRTKPTAIKIDLQEDDDL